MLTLEQVQLLDERIRKAIALISRLREENNSLSEQINILKMHNDELKDFAKNSNQDNELIEKGIVMALSQLDQVEGLNEVMPIEDINRSDEFAEFDTSSATHTSFDDQTHEEADNTFNYEDDDADPLV